ncbi:YdbL family protein [Parvibaculum sp.]|uniref:YdbL family protein n=1 Tax=Parvibaculum sp. TaxID=2024848 RepID=UPI00272F853C|nr:YdbL family protein [Parvibaculum sp.]MDP1628797.1 YdbL family protein [Parvibaculum sp.]MDP2148192.1 YdbL family protein [Parvibaculum sp.]MDP3329274.1 YdbL family protein [Parvibaculum sp.]
MRLFPKSILAMLMLAASLFAAAPAFAIDLDSAKAQGLVGEQLTGYVGIVTASPTPELRTMVNDINLRRRASYQEIAAKTAGATLNAVEKLAAEKLIAKTPSGQYVQNASGQWVKKP